jgi:hypothetical protein
VDASHSKKKKKVKRVAHKILKIERKKLERRVVHWVTIHDKSNANEIKITTNSLR